MSKKRTKFRSLDQARNAANKGEIDWFDKKQFPKKELDRLVKKSMKALRNRYKK